MPTSLCVCGPSVAVITRLFCSSREYCFYRKVRLFAQRFVMIASAFRLLCAPPFCGVCGVRCNSVKWTKKPWIAHGCWFGIRGWIPKKKTINFDDFFFRKVLFFWSGEISNPILILVLLPLPFGTTVSFFGSGWVRFLKKKSNNVLRNDS